MRFRHVVAALTPVGAASAALAVLPLGASATAASAPAVSHFTAGHLITVAPHHVIPEISSPLAYKYVGMATKPAASGFLFSCQQPGASPNCYTPKELATAYDIPKTLTGAGQTIVIIDAFGSPTIAQDLRVEDTTFGIPAASLKIFYPNGKPAFDASNANEVNWTGETALDVESAHAIAPAAKIDLVVAKNDQDAAVYSALKYAVSHHLGNVLSQSYGEAESCEVSSLIKAEHALFATAAAQHVSVFASSGDDGVAQPTCDNSSYIKSVGLPAADPDVTAVGATSLTASQPGGGYKSEAAWNDSYGSSGGGYSKLFSRPSYQNGVVPSHSRGIPDVSYSGDAANGLLIAWSQGDPTQVGGIYAFGGTSAGSPAWAAIAALADQSAHHSLGLLNAQLYALERGPYHGYVFHDVTRGNNSVSFTDSNNNTVNITGYPTAKGWDPVTGLGTPNVAQLLKHLH